VIEIDNEFARFIEAVGWGSRCEGSGRPRRGGGAGGVAEHEEELSFIWILDEGLDAEDFVVESEFAGDGNGLVGAGDDGAPSLCRRASKGREPKPREGSRPMMNGRWLVLAAFVVIATMVGGCSDNETAAEREAKIRREVANAVAKAKPEIKEAGREVKAAAEGVKEGWEGSGKKPLDLNTASADDLASLPGIGRGDAKRIIAGRPYRQRHELVSKRILTEGEYEKVREHVTVK
jgi:hypothetical protein